MQKTSRMPPVIAIDSVEANVVRLQRRSAAVRDEDSSFPAGAEALSALMERASNAVRQMRYFSLAIKRFSFDELTSSARRAGFRSRRKTATRRGLLPMGFGHTRLDLLGLILRPCQDLDRRRIASRCFRSEFNGLFGRLHRLGGDQSDDRRQQPRT